MTSPYLMQTGIVEQLLGAATNILPILPEGESKQAFIKAMDNFKDVITPSAISLSEIYEYLSTHSIAPTKEEAINLLENAAYDIDLNYATDAVIYHVDEYISGID